MACDFDHQITDAQVRIVVLNCCTAPGNPVTKIAGQNSLEKGETRTSANFSNRVAWKVERETFWWFAVNP